VPSRYRDRLGPQFIVTIALPDKCLALYPREAWERDFGKRLDEAAEKDKDYRNFVRYWMRHTEELSPDGQGRVLIPQALRAYAGIEREVVFAGTGSGVELWAKDRYTEVVPSDDEAEALRLKLRL
jgi:MraZ protein